LGDTLLGFRKGRRNIIEDVKHTIDHATIRKSAKYIDAESIRPNTIRPFSFELIEPWRPEHDSSMTHRVRQAFADNSTWHRYVGHPVNDRDGDRHASSGVGDPSELEEVLFVEGIESEEDLIVIDNALLTTTHFRVSR
jgi:hypothetical protein